MSPPCQVIGSQGVANRENGIQTTVVQGKRRVDQRLRLLRGDFTSPVPVEIHSLDGCRDQFGV
ncbi:hypothetical protein [Planotetraspora kaengkrachanensis]|uniref:Uncharacterized protein n=1 Tax=Planotetraspora kaengkrachanensis TaxID=575193 RepID=A0A8J3PW14_9ACTN|nr:hypothetical protein [Planotetraspora kaengkrachanensis]GIG82126.1 hypothetical protein Pka01_52530 [Planotetraspora kaengkrachanensis]